eukprot:5274546-Amphidinium_carterae.2
MPHQERPYRQVFLPCRYNQPASWLCVASATQPRGDRSSEATLWGGVAQPPWRPPWVAAGMTVHGAGQAIYPAARTNERKLQAC